MGEISEALGRARKESEGSQHAKRAGQVPAAPSPHDRAAPDSTHTDLREELRTANTQANAPDPARRTASPSNPVAAPPSDVPRLSEMTADIDNGEGPLPSHKTHVIPLDRGEGWVGRLCAVEPQGPQAVRFRHLAVRVRSLLEARQRRSVLVTSALPGEGKTTVSVNLALALSSIAPEYRIALVDFDLRRGRVGATLGYTATAGVEDVLTGHAPLEEVCVSSDSSGLDFFPMSKPMNDAHRLLGGPAQTLLADLHRQYDFVVIDGPPVLPVPDIPLLTPHVGGCLAVVASGRTRQAAFRDLLELVPRHAFLGVFLNESRAAAGGNRYGYYESEPASTQPGVIADETAVTDPGIVVNKEAVES